MKTSELIKQLKELKESFKASKRQIDADKKVYDKMQYIAGILNEDEQSDSEEIPVGTEFYVHEPGLTDTGRGMIANDYVVVGKEGDLYKVTSKKLYDKGITDLTTTAVNAKAMTADYINSHKYQ